MVGWHHRLNGHEFEQTLGDGGGQGSLVRYSPWGHREPDTNERLNGSSRARASLHLHNYGSLHDGLHVNSSCALTFNPCH